MRVWLRASRKALGLTQQDVATAVNVRQSFYSHIEHGVRRPSPETAKKIASVLGFDWTRFYEDKEGDESLGQVSP